MIMLKYLLNEGVDDPGILKAIFIAGGPGSGKSFVSQRLFGVPENIGQSFGYGMKVVNSDAELERMLTKYGFGHDLDDMPDELFKQLTDPDYEDYSGLRGRARELTADRLELYKKGRLGLILDTTGAKLGKAKRQKKELEELGYDCYMIFVETDLEIAQQRNMQRKRKLPPDLLEKSWKAVMNNKNTFKSMFGKNFQSIQNNVKLEDEKSIQEHFTKLVKKGIGGFLKKSTQNKIGKGWIKKQRILKK